MDAALKASLREDGLTVASFGASLLFEPWTVQTGSGTPYSVFTPFWRACQAMPTPRAPLPEPRSIPGPRSAPQSDDLDDWQLLPTDPDWAGGLRETWEPGEPAARARLREFLADDLADYDRSRDEPSAGATSGLSPRLRWGELSPHTVWHETVESGQKSGRFLSEIGWREFAAHVLYHHPDLATKNLRPEFDAFPWPRLHPAQLRAWQQGRTGIPLVDAGMRELWHTGVMHNRIRMVTASFLIKNLLIDWRRGEEWFWDTLVDADGASNPFNWQWVAGSGADAAPYFRVFNPELQAKKFDPHPSTSGGGRPSTAPTPKTSHPSRSSTSARRAKPRWPPTSRCAARRGDRASPAQHVQNSSDSEPRRALTRGIPLESIRGRTESVEFCALGAAPVRSAPTGHTLETTSNRQEPSCPSPLSPARRRIRALRPSIRWRHSMPLPHRCR